MKPDEFEQQLQQQKLRPVPPGWRSEILHQAEAAALAASGEPSRPARSDSVSFRRKIRQITPAFSGWQEWLWPCPQAWAGLAAIWVILLGLYFVDRPLAPRSSVQTAPPTPETQMALAAQRREMARLLDGPVEPPAAPQRAVPGPRSERMSPSKA